MLHVIYFVILRSKNSSIPLYEKLDSRQINVKEARGCFLSLMTLKHY